MRRTDTWRPAASPCCPWHQDGSPPHRHPPCAYVQEDPSARRTPRGSNAALASRLAAARASLDTQLTTRSLQLDLTQPPSTATTMPQHLVQRLRHSAEDEAEEVEEGAADGKLEPRWSLVAHGLARVAVVARRAGRGGEEGEVAVVVQAAETAPPLVGLLLPSCLGKSLRSRAEPQCCAGVPRWPRPVRAFKDSKEGLLVPMPPLACP